jgi:lipopolysaccharide export system protein LptA
MKKFFLMAALALVSARLACAATNSVPRVATEISSDRADFDLDARHAVYYGNVFVDDPKMKLNCERLTVMLPQSGGRPERIIAEKNVVIDFTDDKGQTNHVTSQKAVYTYKVESGVTNEVMTFTGDPQPELKNATMIQTGDVIVWTRANDADHIHITNPHTVPLQNLNSNSKTNAASPKFF